MRRIRSDDVIGPKARHHHVYETVELEFEPRHSSREQNADTSTTPTAKESPSDGYKVCGCGCVGVGVGVDA